MPPKVKITKEKIVSTAVNLVRKHGADALNARNLAVALKCSTQPVFSNYSSMEALKTDVILAADKLFQEFMQKNAEAIGENAETLGEDGEAEKCLMYQAAGIAYIRFAAEEKELFKLLFMRDRLGETAQVLRGDSSLFVNMVQQQTGLSYEKASLFHLEMWIFVHGIAAMLVTSFWELDWETISRMLTDAYEGLLWRYGDEAQQPDEKGGEELYEDICIERKSQGKE